MSATFIEAITPLIQQLIQRVSGLNDDTETFNHVEKNVLSHIKCADSMFFAREKDIDRIIDSVCKKFELHGFMAQSKDLQRIYKKLTPPILAKQERINRMNVINFLLNISDSPTNNVYEYPKTFDRGDEEESIDWSKYLMEGIPRWSPPPDNDSSDAWSDVSESMIALDTEDVTDGNCKYKSHAILVQENDCDVLSTYSISKTNLLSHVQSEWFNHDYVRFKPASDDQDANVALLWDDFVELTTRGLIPIKNSNIISEYKIMREVIWQLHEPHSSFCFKFVGNDLIPKTNVTISSVRTQALESLLYEFVPYINSLQILREFHESLNIKYDDPMVVPPDTYRSYDYALQDIVGPIFNALLAIEEKIKAQEQITTLLTLAQELKPLFQTAKILKDIHCNVTLDFQNNSPLKCTTMLLSRLHKGLFYASSKLEQDIYLTLYLHSLYKYFTIIDTWLGGNLLTDYAGEFVIADENPKDVHVLFNQSLVTVKPVAENQSDVACCTSRKVQQGEQDWQMQFVVKDLNDDARADNLINLICTQVLQIGKNIHLLRVLGKLHRISEFTTEHKETVYEAYMEKIIKNISLYFNTSNDIDEVLEDCEVETPPSSPTFVFPATCADECKYLTEMDKLENLVDTTDGFLMCAFESFFIKKNNVKKDEAKKTLFEKISELTKSLFPVQQMIEHVFMELLKERYSVSGLVVKDVLINDYHLVKQFEFLKNVFLFKDDLIFPLYRRIFELMDSNGIWGNDTRLTTYLQDIIMDVYPNFYEECWVKVKDNWKLCTDPLKACRMISIHYQIHWPVNIIIRNEHMIMYSNLFQFILKIKWALYTLNHLYFTELEARGKSVKGQPKSLRMLITKLKILRFRLINIFSNIQHYILGHIFNKFSSKFDQTFEDVYDLESLLKAHNDFIQSLHKACHNFQEYNSSSYGFYLLLYLVRKLRIMWRNIREVKDDELQKCETSYSMCYKKIDPIINPTSYASYISND